MKNTSKNIQLSVSIIASDLSNFGGLTKSIDRDVIDFLHMDVMDGHFVPNLTFGPGYIEDLKKNTDIPLDVHLMIEKPEDTIQQYIDINPWSITIHYESTRFPVRTLNLIRKTGITAGISLNPATPVESIFDIMEYVDMVLIMSVDPGFYGQSFIESSVKKIEKLHNYKIKHGYKDMLIQVDGGINNGNVSKVTGAGADIIVAGSSAFKDGDVNKNGKDLKKNSMKTI